MSEPVTLRVNGVERTVEADPATPLLSVLRGPLGLTGTHFGCGANQCGACNVLIEGQAVAACDTPLWAAAGKDVTTVEGLGTPERPHALQRAFIAEQAAQCGYCLSGILISAAALLRRNPDPSEAQVRAALDRNLCRCGAHNRIVRAVLRAAKEARQGMTAELPVNLKANPRLSRWLRFSREGFVELSPGKVEIGQGIVTALAQIAADELDVDLDRIRMVQVTTAASPNEGITSGSLSVEQSGSAVRYAAAAGALDLSGAGGAAARRGAREPAHRGRHDRRAGQPAHQLLGARRRQLAGSRCDARRRRQSAAARRVAGTSVSTAGYPRQGVRPSALHSRARAAGNAARPRAEARVAGREAHRRWMMRARSVPGVIAVVRDGNFLGRGQRDRGWRRGRARGAAQGCGLGPETRCPTRTSSRSG